MHPRLSDRASADDEAGPRTDGPESVRERLFRLLVALVSFRRDLDGRILVVVALAIYFLVVAIPRVLFGVDVWPALGVPSGPSLFFDTRNVTAALECRRLGFDPLLESPCDPWGRPMNYPRVWLALRWLGLDQSHTEALAFVFIALFLISVLLVLGRISLGEGILVALAVCSPAVMFAIERANMDIVVFSLLALAVLVWGMRAAWSETLSPLIVLLAATAKIYPAVGLGAFLFSRRRRPALIAVLCGIAFLGYAALTWSDIQAVARTAPQGQYYSFGARILPAALYHLFVPDRWMGALTKQLVAVVPLLLAAPALWLWGRRLRPSPDSSTGRPSLVAFHLGSLLFLGTFAIANNFDYRLVFLLLTLPQLFRWVAAAQREPKSRLAGLTLVVVLGLLWVGALSQPLKLADEVVTWTAAALLATLVAASLPPIPSLALMRRRRSSTLPGR